MDEMTDKTDQPGEGESPAAEAEATDTQAEAADAAAVAETAEAAATVEAILFSSDSPVSPAKIAEVAELPSRREVRGAIAALNSRYERTGSAFRIESIAGGYQMLTLPEYHDVVSRLHRAKSDSRLSQAAMETLAVVAYRQPVLRADIEAIRGVACGEVLRGLMERQLVKIAGRAEVLGRPMLYGTTRHFLELFGLNSLEDLPKVEELRGGAEGGRGKPAASSAPEGAPAEPAPPEAGELTQVQPAPAEHEAEAPAEEPAAHESRPTESSSPSADPAAVEPD